MYREKKGKRLDPEWVECDEEADKPYESSPISCPRTPLVS